MVTTRLIEILGFSVRKTSIGREVDGHQVIREYQACVPP